MKKRTDRTIPDAQKTMTIYGVISQGFMLEEKANGQQTTNITKSWLLKQSNLHLKFTVPNGNTNL